jgi:hypothetical protein
MSPLIRVQDDAALVFIGHGEGYRLPITGVNARPRAR